MAAVRGKKRYIYEFGYKLEWELDAGGNDEDDLRGTMTLPDIDGTVAEGDWHDLSDFTVEGGIPAARRTQEGRGGPDRRLGRHPQGHLLV